MAGNPTTNNSHSSSQYFGYLFLVNFEVSGHSVHPPNRSEIIQFSYAIYDLETNSVIFQDLHYIRPEFTEVSNEQLQALNISRSELMEAGSLSDAVQQFDSQMFAKCQDTRKPIAILTFGKNVFKDYFRTDAKRKNITLFHHYNHFIDLVQLIREKHPEIVGEDLRSLATVVKRMDIQEKVEAGLAPGVEECLLQSLVLQHLLSRGLKLGKENVCVIPDEYDPPEESAPSTDLLHIVRMRGLPWDIKETELVEFFKPVCAAKISDVKIVLGFDGRTNGEAYVLLGSVGERDSAIRELHGRYIGRRWIEVFKASEEEYNRYMANKRAITGGCTAIGESVLRLRGLPWSSNEYEITKFFKEEGGFNISVDQVVMGYGGDNRLSGEAWVTLETPEKAEECRKALHRKSMGRRYIELFASTQSDLEAAKSYKTGQPSAGPMRHKAAAAIPPAQYGFQVVRMRGLPFHANEQHIVNFFHGYHMAAILPATAPVNGRPSGEAYVQFLNANEAWRAYQERQGALMDRRYIELFAATQREMDFAAAGADPRTIRERAGRPY